MIRRDFLNLLALFTIDPDPEKLIWTPKKTIFIPSGIHYTDVMAIEVELVMEKLIVLFKRNDAFYAAIQGKK